MNTLTQYRRPYAGFTLLELLVVMAIIGVLVGIMLPAFAGIKKKARQRQAEAEVKTLATAIRSYRTELAKWPVPAAALSSGGTWSDNNDQIIERLSAGHADNQRRNYYEMDGDSSSKVVYDVFRSNMAVRISINVTGNYVRVWSCGPNGVDEGGGGDDIDEKS